MNLDRVLLNARDDLRAGRSAARTALVEALQGPAAPPPLSRRNAFARQVILDAAPRYAETGVSGERIYLAEFAAQTDQFVKIGLSGKYGQARRTNRPLRWPRRIAEHRRDWRKKGFTLVDLWVSPPLWNERAAEAGAIDALAKTGARRTRREYFHGLDYDTALDIVLTMEQWPAYLDMDWSKQPEPGHIPPRPSDPDTSNVLDALHGAVGLR